MIHLYECNDGATTYWEVYDGDPTHPAGNVNEYCEHIITLDEGNEYELYIDVLKAKGLDFVLHTLLEYEEYHLAMEKV